MPAQTMNAACTPPEAASVPRRHPTLSGTSNHSLLHKSQQGVLVAPSDWTLDGRYSHRQRGIESPMGP